MIVNSPCTIRTDCDNPSGAVSKDLLKINGAGKFVPRTLTTDPIDGICMETLPGSKMIVIVGNGLAEKFTGGWGIGGPGQYLIQATASTISAVTTPATNDRIIGKVLGTSFGSQAGDGWIISCFDTNNGVQASGGSVGAYTQSLPTFATPVTIGGTDNLYVGFTAPTTKSYTVTIMYHGYTQADNTAVFGIYNNSGVVVATASTLQANTLTKNNIIFTANLTAGQKYWVRATAGRPGSILIVENTSSPINILQSSFQDSPNFGPSYNNNGGSITVTGYTPGVGSFGSQYGGPIYTESVGGNYAITFTSDVYSDASGNVHTPLYSSSIYVKVNGVTVLSQAYTYTSGGFHSANASLSGTISIPLGATVSFGNLANYSGINRSSGFSYSNYNVNVSPV